MIFGYKSGKILKCSKFSIRLTSEALVLLLCFPMCWVVFVSREEIQTMILSTEWLLCHVGELRYGLIKFSGGKPKTHATSNQTDSGFKIFFFCSAQLQHIKCNVYILHWFSFREYKYINTLITLDTITDNCFNIT